MPFAQLDADHHWPSWEDLTTKSTVKSVPVAPVLGVLQATFSSFDTDPIPWFLLADFCSSVGPWRKFHELREPLEWASTLTIWWLRW